MIAPAERKRLFATAGALIAWSAVALQFYLILENRQASVPETIVRFFSFFTILTNILVALCFTFLANAKTSGDQFLTRPPVLSAVTVYIIVVGLVYNVVLRFLWSPQGLQRVVDEVLHLVVPLMFVLYWLFFVDKATLKWKHALSWLLYPLVYVVFVLARGAIAGFYPYPFIDVPQLGYPVVFRNCLFLFGVFLLLSALLIGGTLLANRRSTGKR